MLTQIQKNKIKKYLEPCKFFEVYTYNPSNGDDITLGACKTLKEAERFRTFLTIEGLKGKHEIYIDEWTGSTRVNDYKGQIK